MLFDYHSAPLVLHPPRRRSIIVLVLILFGWDPAVGLGNKQETDFTPPKMQIPDGYEIELVAGPPLTSTVARPPSLDWACGNPSHLQARRTR